MSGSYKHSGGAQRNQFKPLGTDGPAGTVWSDERRMKNLKKTSLEEGRVNTALDGETWKRARK